MRIAKPLGVLIASFEKLPGIGPKSAQRLAYYLLHVPQSYLDDFSDNLQKLKRDTSICKICKNVDDIQPCSICSDKSRDQSIVLVVERPLDLIAFEKSGTYKGLYHVLHGSINPLENIGPDEIYIKSLVDRISQESEISEVIIATNPTMEGEATAIYLLKQLKNVNHNLKVSRLGMGIPTGADLEYADEITLTRALEGRRELV